MQFTTLCYFIPVLSRSFCEGNNYCVNNNQTRLGFWCGVVWCGVVWCGVRRLGLEYPPRKLLDELPELTQRRLSAESCESHGKTH